MSFYIVREKYLYKNEVRSLEVFIGERGDLVLSVFCLLVDV